MGNHSIDCEYCGSDIRAYEDHDKHCPNKNTDKFTADKEKLKEYRELQRFLRKYE